MKHTVVSTIAFAPAYLYNKTYAIFLNCFLQVLAFKASVEIKAEKRCKKVYQKQWGKNL